jgi:uncharacterized protein
MASSAAPPEVEFRRMKHQGDSWSRRPPGGFWTPQGVTRTSIDQGKVKGELYAPVMASGRPALIVVGGSEGGVAGSASIAASIASAGFPALAVAYFGERGLPEQLREVPLETFGRAIAWLSLQPCADPERLGIVGGSKGAEAALLAASRYPQLRVAIAGAPTHVAWQAIDRRHWGRASSWSYQGLAVPFIRYRGWLNPFKPLAGYYTRSLSAASNVDESAIPVEQIHGAVLIVSGSKDTMWSATAMGQAIVDRLRHCGFSHPYEHWIYPEAGHAAFGPLPPDGHPAMKAIARAFRKTGGSARANVAARRDSWPKFVSFLRVNLGEPVNRP